MSEIEKNPNYSNLFIGGKIVDLEDIYKNQGMAAYFESVPGKGQDIEVFVSPAGVSVNPINSDIAEFGFSAEVSGLFSKEISFSILLKLPDGNGTRYPNFPSGRQLVESSMEFLERNNRIKTFHAEWRKYSDNYTSYYNHLNSGFSPQEAALSTWSGINIARKYQFTKKISVKPKIGEYGEYIDVKFSR